MRLLFVGDMHLGRRLPGSVRRFAEGEGLLTSKLLPVAAFRSVVDLAIRKEVKAVVFAGDLIEKMEDRFYAFPALEEGVGRLVEAGVQVLAVCGNHDVEALPRLAKRIEGFRILGVGGKWESVDLEEGGRRLRVTGWSFPTREVRENPLQGFDLEHRPTEGAWVGVLHADLDGGGSRYAPVPRRELEELPLDAWFLGHVHGPADLGEGRFVGYLGSLQGLDAGEPGVHGPLLWEQGEKGGASLRRIPVASLAFTKWEMDLGRLEGGFEDQKDRLHQEICEGLKALGAGWEAEVLGVRLILKGATRNLSALRDFLDQRLEAGELRAEAQGTCVFVEKIIDRLRPLRELGELLLGGGPLGRLAAKLQALEEGGKPSETLVRELAGDLGSIKGLDSGWSPGRIREEALSAGREVLDTLLEEIEEGR